MKLHQHSRSYISSFVRTKVTGTFYNVSQARHPGVFIWRFMLSQLLNCEQLQQGIVLLKVAIKRNIQVKLTYLQGGWIRSRLSDCNNF